MAEKGLDDNVINLLLILCRDELTNDEKLKAESIASAVTDWNQFYNLALKNGVAAILWYNITGSGVRVFIPETIQHNLEGAMQRTIARVEFISSKAAEITRILGNRGIKTVLLKGQALEHTVYGNKGLRQMSDVDILVLPTKCLKAWYTLKEHGFISRSMKSPLHKRIMIYLGNHLPELHKDGISVDVHHRLFQGEATDLIFRAFNESEEIEISGVKCYILPPRAAFLAMIKHMIKHGLKEEFQVRLYTDAFLILKYRRDEILCDDLLTDADKAGISKELKETLFLISRYWHYQIPDNFIAGLTYTEKEQCQTVFLKGLMNPGHVVTSGNKDIYYNTLKGIPGIGKKMLYLLGDLFPSLAFMKKRYNCKGLFSVLMHYPLRFGKIIWFAEALMKK